MGEDKAAGEDEAAGEEVARGIVTATCGGTDEVDEGETRARRRRGAMVVVVEERGAGVVPLPSSVGGRELGGEMPSSSSPARGVVVVACGGTGEVGERKSRASRRRRCVWRDGGGG